MSTERPLVTIGMPVRNSEATIALTIASIVVQTYAEWELVIVDDGSSDATLRVVRSFSDPRIRVFSDGLRKGIPIRRNEIIAKSSGKYLAWMDGDDVAYPERVAVEVAFLESHPSVHLVAAEMTVFRDDGEIVGKRSVPTEHATICRRPYSGFPMSQPTFMGRLSWFQQYRYDERMKRGQDQELLLRAFRHSTYAGIQQILVGYRETRIDLSKIFLTRRLWVAAVLRDARQNSSLLAGARAALLQAVKFSADVLAVVTGLNYVLLRHRARATTRVEQDKFQAVFASALELSKRHAHGRKCEEQLRSRTS